MGLFSSEPSPVEKAVIKATDEALTREDWSLIIDACNLVNEQPDRNGPLAVQAVCQRLNTGNGNIQLYSLTLLNALAQNCGPATQREIASTATSACLTKVGTLHATHVKVLVRLVDVLGQLREQFAADATLKQVDVVYNRVISYPHTRELLRQAGALPAGNAGTAAATAVTPQRDAKRAPPAQSTQKSIEEQEEEDLRRALELSMQDVSRPAAEIETAANAGHTGAPARKNNRVRALYDFAASEEGELSFSTGDVIEVLDVVYKEWWRGKLRNEVGIFPVNYVEQLEDEVAESSVSVLSVPHSAHSYASPSSAGAVRRMSATSAASGPLDEAYIFTQAATVDKLLSILATANQDGSGGSVVENEDIQSLYHQVASMRPRVIQLIDEYAMRKQELVDLNNKLLQARRSYDRLMEDAVSGYARQTQTQTPTPAPAAAGWPYGQSAAGAPALHGQAPPAPQPPYSSQTFHQQIAQPVAPQTHAPSGSVPQTPALQYASPPAAAPHAQQAPPAPPAPAAQQFAPRTYSLPQYAAPAANYYMPTPADSRQSVASAAAPDGQVPSPAYNSRLPYPESQSQPLHASMGSIPYANGVPTSPR